MSKDKMFFGAPAALAAFPLICVALGVRQFFPGPPLIAFVAVPVIVVAVEIAAVGWQRSSLCRALRLGGSTRADILLTAAALTGFAPAMVTIFSFGASYLVGLLTHSVIQRATGFNLHIDTGNGVANFGVYY